MRGAKNDWLHLKRQLSGFYGRMVGELRSYEHPAKSLGRKWRGRDARAAHASEDAQRAELIRGVLPSVERVMAFLEPAWRPEDARVVRPSRPKLGAPPVGWTEAAIEVLRRAERFLSMSEIADRIEERYDEVDLTPTGARQSAYTAISANLRRTYSDQLVRDGRGRWAWKDRAIQLGLINDGDDAEAKVARAPTVR